MRWFGCLAILLVVPFVLASEAEQNVLPELEINTVFKPAECIELAESGDYVKVHYVRVQHTVLAGFGSDLPLFRLES